MHKLLCIVGPTGTGKTALAIKLTGQEPSILISADSRQVYRGMNIVTGKDHPPGTIIYGLDLVDPDESCSVAVWYDAVMPHFNQAWQENKQVIVVGGTGLYVKAITHGIETIGIPVNQQLRDKLLPLSITELQKKLNQLDPSKFANMNNSDQNNPRRLTRAIEVTIFRTSHPERAITSRTDLIDSKLIGLRYYDNSNYGSKIHERVLTRLSLGAIAETKKLMNFASPQALSAIGYRSICAYLHQIISYDQMIEQWIHDEFSYVKRQLTWFRNIKSIKWYDVNKGGYDYPKN
ncbi:MAG: tRNA delta(2)-isopentenylpyrophosphate transferase [uncultured bacterium]|nr:MAG: tRNA delta(2)-isopentenylpyrophosphate transferase [uncultured bacterium]KKU26363.1 MAG: tRNA delta(2)-isopentenylpyrophosphate transferase [Microgenomates group bacterium GW2011_GWA2_46_16]